MLKVNTKTTGFGSPAETYIDSRLDLNDLIPIDPITTYYFRYANEEKFGILPNDIVVVDRAIQPTIGDLVLVKADKILLQKFENQENIWGTIMWVISQRKKLP